MLTRFILVFILSAVSAACSTCPCIENANLNLSQPLSIELPDEAFDGPPFEGVKTSFGTLKCNLLTAKQEVSLLETHTYGGAPSTNSVLIRRGYVTEFDEKHRIPRWAFWLEEPDYRWTPTRSGRWASFREDPDIENPVNDDDYDGLFETPDNFARGHLTPYYISGGDRDYDGDYAVTNNGKTLDDPYDACTVYEINYMSNITPQYHRNFNGSGGLWYELESTLRDLVDSGHVFHVVAGTIFSESDIQYVGPKSDIGVPDMFYKIIITDDAAIPFLFAHRKRLSSEACRLSEQLEDCITTIVEIEKWSGLDFFREFSRDDERFYEESDGLAAWRRLVGGFAF